MAAVSVAASATTAAVPDSGLGVDSPHPGLEYEIMRRPRRVAGRSRIPNGTAAPGVQWSMTAGKPAGGP